MIDLMITDARIADGTGNPLRRANVAIDGDRIVGVGRLSGVTARRTIDAEGRLVCPGFVDPHSHSDRAVLSNPEAHSTIRQGVTTEIVGNCGMTSAPVTEHNRESTATSLREFGWDGEVTWSTFGEMLEVISQQGHSQNLAWLIGHNAIRGAAGAGPEPSDAAQLDAMRAMVDEAMRSGALGMSTGLEFRPGSWATTEEIVELNKVVGRHGGIYASHVRNRDEFLQEAVEEFIRIVREGATRGEFSHLNIRHNSGPTMADWRRAVDTLIAAREEGLEILVDTTPYNEGPGRMTAILPEWLTDQPVEKVLADLADPQIRQRLRGECDRYWRFIHRGHWEQVRLLSTQRHPEYTGLTFPEIAALRGTDEWDAFFDLLVEAGPGLDDMMMLGRFMTDELQFAMFTEPIISLGVDIITSSVDGPLASRTPHPMFFSGQIHYLTTHVIERGTLRLEEAIRKMSSMPAAHFGLHDRGLLREGFAADVVMMDLDRLSDGATMEDPVRYVEGVDLVLVNGVVVVEDGEHTGARPGRRLGWR